MQQARCTAVKEQAEPRWDFYLPSMHTTAMDTWKRAVSPRAIANPYTPLHLARTTAHRKHATTIQLYNLCPPRVPEGTPAPRRRTPEEVGHRDHTIKYIASFRYYGRKVHFESIMTTLDKETYYTKEQTPAHAMQARSKQSSQPGGVYHRARRFERTRIVGSRTTMRDHSTMVSTLPYFLLLNSLFSEERLDFFSKRRGGGL